jgi:hypothetical protein
MLRFRYLVLTNKVKNIKTFTYPTFYRYKVTPIIWDDMMRHISTRTLMDSEIGKLVEPMVWVSKNET